MDLGWLKLALARLTTLTGSEVLLVAIGLLATTGLLVLAIGNRRSRRRLRQVNGRHQRLVELLAAVTPTATVEAQLLCLLQPLQLIPAEYYACYLWDADTNQYQLAAVRRHSEQNGVIEVGYGRLTAYVSEEQLPPLCLPAEAATERVTWDREAAGGGRLVLSLGQRLGLVLIAPVQRCSAHQLLEITELRYQLAAVLELLVARQEASPAALASPDESPGASVVPPCASNRPYSRATLELLRKLCRADGCLLVQGARERPELLVCGDSGTAESALRQDCTALQELLALGKADGPRRFTALHPDYGLLPAAVVGLGDELLLLGLPGTEATLLLWASRQLISTGPALAALPIVASRLADALRVEADWQSSGQPSLPALRALTAAMEADNPCHCGHSELVARYALAIAKELQLSEQECRDVALAGALHDLGALTLEPGPASYTTEERRELYRHAADGAQLLQLLLVNQPAASYVRHHHEQFSGGGYPDGLQGEQIPIGARILAVAEVFVAKLSGRQHRPPLAFEQALRSVQQAAGQQLDPAAVQALLNWYQKKQRSLANQEQLLAPCWVMRCSPVTVCRNCPAYQHPDRRCWETPGVTCSAHGNDCRTCPVRSEWQQRQCSR